MRTFATLNNFTSSEARDIVVRNLNRIMDIAILDLDIEHSTITFLYASQAALEKAKRELSCIGFPIKSFKVQNGASSQSNLTYPIG